MNQNDKTSKVQEAVETDDPARTGELIVELLLDDGEDVGDIAADFIENEVGRFDWVNNWQVVRSKRDPAAMVQDYLNRYSLVADANAVVAAIDRMAEVNPGRWK